MKTEFNVTGSERKHLVQVIAASTGETSRYMGMPSMAYEIGPFTVTKDGTLEFSDSTDSDIVEKLYEDITAVGFEVPDLSTGTESAETDGETCGIGLTVILPKDTLSEDALRNLDALLTAKGTLIRKAMGVEDLPVEVGEKAVSFPWFNGALLTTEEVHAYTHFISALCEMARNQKRITAKEKDVDNDKYAFRCFLLRLGFIGAEYKTERKILLRNLSGSSAFRNGGAAREISE